MAKTVHVIPAGSRWTIKREGARLTSVFPTQKEAIVAGRDLAKKGSSGQLVVHSRSGAIREYHAYGMPAIKVPPGGKSARIERAVSKVTLDRLNDPIPPPWLVRQTMFS